MKFIDKIRTLSLKAQEHVEFIQTKDATKTALVMPMLDALGYNVFDPSEVSPEFNVDVDASHGEKGEKIDFAIMKDRKPIILFECKWCMSDPGNVDHTTALFHVFNATKAKYAVLTNGIVYRFFTDSEEPGKMDVKPFFEFNLFNYGEQSVEELKRFSKNKIKSGKASKPATEGKQIKDYPVDMIKSFVDKITFYSPVKHKNLTIVPVVAPYSEIKGQISTFDEAVSKGTLIIQEVSSSGSVNQLTATNQSDKPVYIMAGEILRGSKQDRVLKDDVLIPAKSEKIIVDCFCVEHGRWSYKSDKFYSGGQNANISVRQAARQMQNQGEVWDRVAKTNAKFEQAPSGSLAKSFESERVAMDRKGYIGEIADIPSSHPDASGVIVLINGKVLAADLFSDPRIFKRLWKKLSDSYTLEAISKQDEKEEKGVTSAKRFLISIHEAEISYTTHPGLGKKVEIKSADITGSGLVAEGFPVHIDIFPKMAVIERHKTGFRRNYR